MDANPTELWKKIRGKFLHLSMLAKEILGVQLQWSIFLVLPVNYVDLNSVI